jgi:hypothetical protein
VVAFATLAGVMMLWWPLGHDQGIFALNGAVVAGGGLPYRDAFETRGPLSFYVYAGLHLLFGPRAWGVRLLDLVIVAFTAFVLFRAVAALATRRAAQLTAAAWVLTVVSLGHQDSAQFELWIACGVLAGVVLVTRDPTYRARDLAAFGVIVGLASLTKQFYPVLLAVPGVVILWRRRTDVRAIVRDLAMLVLACVAPIALMLLWLWSRNGLHSMWEAHVSYSLNVYSAYSGQRETRLSSTLFFLFRGAVVPTALAAGAAGLAGLWRTHRPLALALAMWLVCGLFTVELQGRFFPYHWTILYPALALLAALGCARAAAIAGPGRWLGAALAVSLIVQLSVVPLARLRHWAMYLTGRESADAYYARFDVWQTNPADERAVAHYLRARTREGEPVGMWAVDAAIPYLADRPIATRATVRRTLTWAPEHEITRRYRREFLAQLAARRPTYFIVNLNRDAHERPLDETFPELGALVRERYAPDTTIGALEILRLREASGGPTAAPAGHLGGRAEPP